MTEQTGNNKPNEAERLAFTPTDNKKLIEEAAKAIYETRDDAYDMDPWEQLDSTQRERYVCDARVALAVFEKAHTPTPPDGWFYMGSHVAAAWLALEFSEEVDETGLPLWERPVQGTPTDDEREALEQIVIHVSANTPGDLISSFRRDAIVQRILAAGFRRSEVPEPSAEGPAFIALMPPSPETSKRWYSMYCRVCGIEEMMAGTADDPRLLARRDEHNRERHAEPQGEPSDARAKVIDALVMTRLSDFAGTDMGVIEQAADAVLAALRAAGGVR